MEYYNPNPKPQPELLKNVALTREFEDLQISPKPVALLGKQDEKIQWFHVVIADPEVLESIREAQKMLQRLTPRSLGKAQEVMHTADTYF